MSLIDDLVDTYPEEPPPGFEEPNCGACSDTGSVPQDADGHDVLETDSWSIASWINCPHCRPTPEQVEAANAEYNRAVAAGEIVHTDPPF